MDCVSIMMVSFNRLNLTKQTLDSLFKETNYPFRLIIVDNYSEDGTQEFLQTLKIDNSFCQSYDFHLCRKNWGIAHGRSLALKIADKYNDEWLSTIDNDVLFNTNWLTDCVNVLKVNKNFMIGLNFEDINYPIQNWNGYEVQTKPNGNLGSACMVFPKELHNQLGYFVSYGLYGEEDSNLGIRARVLLYKMGYLPKNGIHLGTGENDIGEYREWKTKMHAENLEKFRNDCYRYYRKEKPIYEPYPSDLDEII